MSKIIDDYISACDYPGDINAEKVEQALTLYLQELGVKRRVIQLQRGWNVYDYPDILANVNKITRVARAVKDPGAVIDALDAIVAKDARAVIDTRIARDAIAAAVDTIAGRATIDTRIARDAIAAADTRIARDAIEAGAVGEYIDILTRLYMVGGYWWTWELSWLATTYIGNTQILWAKYLYDAFINGAWFLYWTEESLYWFVKPILSTYTLNNRKVLHNEKDFALKSAWQDLCFLNGVLVDKKIVFTPAEKLDPVLALKETNADVQREIIRKIGPERMLRTCNAKTLDDWTYQRTGNRYRLMTMDIGNNIRRKYMYFEHASIPGVFFAKSVPPETTKALHGLAWQRKLVTREKLNNITVAEEAELLANLPEIIC